MILTVDLEKPDDVRAAYAILSQYLKLTPQGVTSFQETPTSASALAAKQFVDALWLRLGQSMRRLVKEAAELTKDKPMITIERLAASLKRPSNSVRSSMNGPLAIAIKNVKKEQPFAPDLWVWQHNGEVYELGMTDEIRAAVATQSLF